MEFNLEQAVTVANSIVYEYSQKNLTDVEIAILEGAWNREEYEFIAARNNYSTSYLSQDVAPKLWKLLSEALGEKVRKSNFKEALKRHSKNVTSQVANHQSTTFDTDSLPDLYVERAKIESVCCQTLSQPGSLLRLKGYRLLGKTSLMNRVLIQLKQNGYATVNISLKLADKNTHFTSLNRFLRWFCINLSFELDLPNKLDEYWDEANLGAKVSCTIYLQDYIFAELDRPLILCIDDVDLLFPYPEIYEDFFALLRSWYEKARTRKCWKNLRLAIIHSTDVYIRLNIYQSPFNIGFPQDLPEFTADEACQLAGKHEVNIAHTELDMLMNLVGGHPFLLQKAFELLKNNRTLTMQSVLAEATTESGIYSNHLRQIWVELEQHRQIAATFYRLLEAKTPLMLDPVQAYKLQNIGLVKLSGNLAEPRCKLYYDYFSQYLSSISEQDLRYS